MCQPRDGEPVDDHAMAALAGVLYFHEPSTTALFAGVGLMTAGILLMDRPRHKA